MEVKFQPFFFEDAYREWAREEEDEDSVCSRPGPRGCGKCRECDEWADEEYRRKTGD